MAPPSIDVELTAADGGDGGGGGTGIIALVGLVLLNLLAFGTAALRYIVRRPSNPTPAG